MKSKRTLTKRALKLRQLYTEIMFLAVSVIILIALTIFYFSTKDVRRNIIIEAGVVIGAADFYASCPEEARFAKDCPPFYLNRPGTYTVIVENGLIRNTCTLTVEDTIAPFGIGTDITTYYGADIKPEDFIASVTEATEVTYSFDKAPDMQSVSSQEVVVRLTDTSGNSSTVNANITLVPVKPYVEIEAGSEPITPESLVTFGEYEYSTLDFDTILYDHIGEYDTNIFIGEEEFYPCHISVVDTVAPRLVAHDLYTTTGYERSFDDYIDELSDATDVTLSFAVKPDYYSVGESMVTILATDEAGNTSSSDVVLSLVEDTEPPVFVDAESFHVFLGSSLSYRRHVTVEDNSGVAPTIDIETSLVNTAELGDYMVTYTATDYSGNVSTKEVMVSVVERSYEDEELYPLIDDLIDSIITPDMTDVEIAKALFDWVKENIEYTGYSDKNNFNKAAIDGLLDFRGDCYTNTAICVSALNRLGIEAMVVRRHVDEFTPNHWWFIVKIGENWYHVDTQPRTWDNPDIFLWTDSQIFSYSINHENTHKYDSWMYPTVSNIPVDQLDL